MNPSSDHQDGDFLSEEVGKKEKLKLNAQRENKGNIWSGLGMFGMVGWSVAVPALLGVALGLWLDKIYRQSFSWTLTFLVIGLFTGSLIAWYWISKEDKKMHQHKEDKDE